MTISETQETFLPQPQPTEPSATLLHEETSEERVRRLYGSDGGPLMGWLVDEAAQRGMSLQELAAELGVTYGYVAQLRNGYKSTASIGKPFAAACARFLGVPTAVVLLLSGFLTLRDFSTVAEPEHVKLNRAMRQLSRNPRVMTAIDGAELRGLPEDTQRMLVNLFSDELEMDPFGYMQLPHMVAQLQRAALVHNGRELESH